MANHLNAKEKDFRPARINRVVVCEDINFFWDRPELKELKQMWEDSWSVEGMAQHFDRDPDEVLIELIHLARESEIFARRRGLR